MFKKEPDITEIAKRHFRLPDEDNKAALKTYIEAFKSLCGLMQQAGLIDQFKCNIDLDARINGEILIIEPDLHSQNAPSRIGFCVTGRDLAVELAPNPNSRIFESGKITKKIDFYRGDIDTINEQNKNRIVSEAGKMLRQGLMADGYHRFAEYLHNKDKPSSSARRSHHLMDF